MDNTNEMQEFHKGNIVCFKCDKQAIIYISDVNIDNGKLIYYCEEHAEELAKEWGDDDELET